MRILVTGGAGFIGSHLCRRLDSEGHEIFCLDDFTTGLRENVVGTLIERDVCAPIPGAYDQIYHLACPASPFYYQKDPIRTLMTSVLGAQSVLNVATRSNCKVLFTSTSEIYGDPTEHPQKEEYFGNVNPIGPRACYDEGKRAAECLFMDYHRKYGIPIRIARIFNTYGPRMRPDDGRVISNFIMQALESKPITLYGSGNATRSFCYVDDIVDGLVKLMESSVTGPVNLGNSSEIKIRDLAETICKQIGTKFTFVCLNSREDDPFRRKPDITKAKMYLGWYPKVGFKIGLEKTVEWFQERMQEAA